MSSLHVPSLASYFDEVIVVLYSLADGFEPSKPNSNTDESQEVQKVTKWQRTWGEIYRGVTFYKRSSKWQAAINVRGKGVYSTDGRCRQMIRSPIPESLGPVVMAGLPAGAQESGEAGAPGTQAAAPAYGQATRRSEQSQGQISPCGEEHAISASRNGNAGTDDQNMHGTALHSMAEQFTEDDNTALHGMAGQGADGDNTALHGMAEQFTEDDNTALHGMAEQFTEDDKTALHGMAGQGADGDNTALHGMAEQFTEDDNTALHGMAGQGED
eukprot:gene22651-29801_t